MYKYEVQNNQPLTPTTQLLTLKRSEQGQQLSFQPGQYVAVSFYRKGRPTPARCFSMVNSPSEPGILQICPRIKGRFTSTVTKLKPGDKAVVRGPFGGFVIDDEIHKEVVLIAGGIGIAPFISMIRHAVQLKTATKITLIYSCQIQDDVPFAQELKKLENIHPNLKVFYLITAGRVDRFKNSRVAIGRATPKFLTKNSGDLSKKTFFICGPPGFMKAVEAMLAQINIPPERVLTEAFSQGPNRQTGKLRSWPYNVYVLTSLGVVTGSFIVMASDLLHNLPLLKTTKPSAPVVSSALGNSRQKDVDDAVNDLPPTIKATPRGTKTTIIQTPSSSPTYTPSPMPAPVTKVSGAP